MKDDVATPKRRSVPGVPFFYPDWLVVAPLQAAIKQMIARYARGVVVDLGCGSSPFYEMLVGRCERYIGIDRGPGPYTDILASIDALPLETSSVETALCTQVFEHVPALEESFAEVSRILRPGGALIFSVPQYSADHEIPSDFRRFTIYGLRALADRHGFEIVEHHRQGGAFAVAALAVNSVLTERIIGKRRRSVDWLAKAVCVVPFFVLTNALAFVCDRLLPSNYDCSNHLVVFRRLEG